MSPIFKRFPRIVRRRPVLEQLEERIVLDAAVDPAITVQQDAPEQNSPELFAGMDQNTDLGGQTASGGGENQETASGHLNVILISNVFEDIQPISRAAAQGALTVTYDGHGADMNVLYQLLSGITQEHAQDIDHLAIVSHGDPGAIEISENHTITVDSTHQDPQSWTNLGGLLAPGAGLDIYGCETGKGRLGKELVNSIADLTSAVVRASDNATGSGPYSDWELEVGSGQSELGYLLDADVMQEANLYLDSPPEAVDDSFTVYEDRTRRFRIYGEDPDRPLAKDVQFDIQDPDNGRIDLIGGVKGKNGKYYQIIRHTPDTNYHGPDTIQFTFTSQGESDQGAIDIVVKPVNDRPENNAPRAQSVDEDSTLIFSAANGNSVYISDDSGDNDIQVQLKARYGSISLDDSNGVFGDLTFSVGDGREDSRIVFKGALEDVNEALDHMSFTPSENYYGNRAFLKIITNDLGNFGKGGAKRDWDTIKITVDPVSDDPEIIAPSDLQIKEDSLLRFNGPRKISISDPDGNNSEVQVSLEVENGELIMNRWGGLDPKPDKTFTQATFEGSLRSVNSALSSLRFSPDPDFYGQAFITITSKDPGASGVDTETIKIDVTPVNDAPIIHYEGKQVKRLIRETTHEDTPFEFSSQSGHLFEIVDPDSGTGDLEVFITSSRGAVTLDNSAPEFADLQFIEGDGLSDSRLKFRAPLSHINSVIDGLTFTPQENYYGNGANFTLKVNDMGNTGGKDLTDTARVRMKTRALNDAPVNVVPGDPQTVDINEDLIFKNSNNNRISVTDVDSKNSDRMKITLTAEHGDIGLKWNNKDLEFDSKTLWGKRRDINRALSKLTFQPEADFEGVASINITSNDLGRRGAGGPQIDSDTIWIHVGDVQIDQTTGPKPSPNGHNWMSHNQGPHDSHYIGVGASNSSASLGSEIPHDFPESGKLEAPESLSPKPHHSGHGLSFMDDLMDRALRGPEHNTGHKYSGDYSEPRQTTGSENAWTGLERFFEPLGLEEEMDKDAGKQLVFNAQLREIIDTLTAYNQHYDSLEEQTPGKSGPTVFSPAVSMVFDMDAVSISDICL